MASKDLEPGDVPVSADTSVAEAAGASFSRRNFLKTVGVGPARGWRAGHQRRGADGRQSARARRQSPSSSPSTAGSTASRSSRASRCSTRCATRLGLTGQKRVCDRGSCGACTVVIDGRTVYACSMLAVEAAGANIRTVEGLADGTVLHPVQQAFCETDGLMCGFCTPGVRDVDGGPAREAPESDGRRGASRARRQHLPVRHLPTRARGGAEGQQGGTPWLTRPATRTTCRCPRYRRPRRPRGPSTRGRSSRGCSGNGSPASTVRSRRPARRSTPTTSSGRGCSTAASSARRTRTPASWRSTCSAALRLPGVKAVIPVTLPPGKKVMYQGDEIAAVAAVTEQAAEDAHPRDQGAVRGAAAPRDRRAGDAPRGARHLRGRQRQGRRIPRRPATSTPASRRPRTSSKATYSTQVQTHVCLETKGCVCEWDGDKLTAWVSTQAVHGTREGFAEALGIPQANVRVICEHMGGGFGSKFGPDVQGIVCAKLAKEAKAPVKLMLDRKEEHLAGGNRPSAHAKIRAGATADGTARLLRRRDVGHGRRGRGRGVPAPLHLRVPEPATGSQGRLHQRRAAARDARAGPPAGLLHHRAADGRARRQGPDGSGGVPPQEPPARRARRDVARLLPDGRGAVRLEQAAPDRRPDARSDQARLRLRGQPMGRRRTRHEGRTARSTRTAAS